LRTSAAEAVDVELASPTPRCYVKVVAQFDDTGLKPGGYITVALTSVNAGVVKAAGIGAFD